MLGVNDYIEQTNNNLATIIILLNAYHMATLNDEQKKVYIDLIQKSGLVVHDNKVVPFNKKP